LRRRVASRSERWRVAVLVPLVLVTSCTGAPVDTASPKTGDDVAALTAVVTTPPTATTVLDSAAGADTATAMSASLFRSAPVVVVAAQDDQAGVATADAVAERIGAPVLLAPSVVRAGSTQPAPGPGDVWQELTRLAPRAVLAVGVDVRRDVEKRVDRVPVFSVEAASRRTPELPDGLPEVTPPDPVAVTVLVDPAHGDTAAIATAHAAGARVVPVRGADPRTDPTAIDALRADPPATVLAVGKEFGAAPQLRTRLDVAVRGTQLPGGGQVLFPGRRLVCLYGHPGAPALGVLGEQDVDASIALAKKRAAEYDHLSDVPVVPAFEIIATVAHGSPGPDGDYSGETSVESLRPWVEAAGNAGLYVVLDLQPGRASLVGQAKLYEPLLRLPHVGLAVDPEWKLGPDQVPLTQIGGADAAEINEVTDWLAAMTARNVLPQKLFVVHQFKLSMIRNEPALITTHDELAMLIHMDGQGTTGQKVATWRSVVAARPTDLPMGWKNFYDEDHPMLTPEQTMAHEPKPVMISYQ
jgi:hypothetical protein